MVTWEFLTAGHAIFTVEPPADFAHPEARPHFTYKISTPPDGKVYFVSALTGPDNTSDYSYFGLLDTDKGTIRSTAKSKIGRDKLTVILAERVIKAIKEGRAEDIASKGWKVHHEGRCGRCGRVLTTPESIESGIGPVCAGRE